MEFSGNDDTAIVTVGEVLEAQIAGQSLSAVGFGTQEASPNVFILHDESGSLPPNGNPDYQMKLSSPDSEGLSVLFDDVSDSLTWFSANVTAADVTIPAGDWVVSLRYQDDRLPSGMDSTGASSIHDEDTIGGGHTLHFNTDPTIAQKDSGQMTLCTGLVDAGVFSITNPWSANIGVNGSGAFLFDGDDDYISIINSGERDDCNNTDERYFAIAGWFNSTDTASTVRQTIIAKDGNDGGFNIRLGGTSDGAGYLGFHANDGSDSVNCWAENDYADNQWHHFVAQRISDTQAELWVDGILEDTCTNGGWGHDHDDDEDIYIGARQGTADEFTGVIDDIMFWLQFTFDQDDVDALKEFSYGEDAHKFDFVILNTTGTGITVDTLSSETDIGLPWGDPMGSSGNLEDEWAGGNYTVNLRLGHNYSTKIKTKFLIISF